MSLGLLGSSVIMIIEDDVKKGVVYLNRRVYLLFALLVVVSATVSHYLTSSHYTLLIQALEENYIDLSIRYSRLMMVAKEMNASLEQVASVLHRYCCLPRVFPEVLNRDELASLKWYVLLYASVDPHDELSSIERIFNWVLRNIRYVGDPRVPLPDRMAICERVGNESYCYYEFREAGDYVQSPTETIRRGGGDCEDHAILVYAMLYYYFRYIRSANYTVWIALMTFGDGSKHAAVFIPAENASLLIVDTSGNYITNVEGIVAPRSAVDELDNYSLLYLRNGGIVRISLYGVDVENASYNLLVTGGLATVVTYIERYTSLNPRSVIPLKR